MQAYNLKRSPSTPSAALLGSACLTSSMTHAGGGPENASPPDFDFNMPCRFFKSSFARSLSLNNNNNNNNCNASKSLDYDCNNYRGNANNNNYNNNNNNSIAKTTTTTNCLPLPKRAAAVAASQNEVSSTTTTTTTTPTNNEVNIHIVNNNNDNDINDHEVDLAVVVGSNDVEVAKLPPALPARRLLPANGSYEQQQQQPKQMAQFRSSSSSLINKVINTQQQQQMSPPSNINSNNNNNNSTLNGNNNHRNYHHHHQQQHHHHSQQQQQHGCQMWPRDVINCQQQQDAGSNAEPRPTAAAAAFELHENTLNVEAVILQNQVDTLQWQLKQVETSCEMYRAVMEEVARFLERYTSHTQQLQQQRQQQHNRNEQQQQIARSKSLYHVHGVGGIGGAHDSTSIMASADEGSNSYLRARSSTNLIGGSGLGGKSMLTLSEEHNYEPIAPAGSYNAFKDFTWRRTPKKTNGLSNIHSLDAGEEKLNQEAFRLSRTIHNLLSTQQPDLTQRNMLAAHTPGRLAKAVSTSVMTLHGGAQPLHNSTSLTIANGLMECMPTSTNANVMPKTPSSLASNVTAAAAAATAAAVTTPDMLFLRANNMRDSRLSLRSSTDSSVHSTISSTTISSASSSSSSSMKLETDEEALTHAANSVFVGTLKPNNAGSSTEDESGFSSISSFQDVGIPLSSTRICSTPRGSLKELATLTANNQSDSRNSTLKAPTPSAASAALTHPNNVIGLPVHGVGAASPSKTYRNAAKYQRFSTLSNEDSATVLWV